MKKLIARTVVALAVGTASLGAFAQAIDNGDFALGSNDWPTANAPTTILSDATPGIGLYASIGDAGILNQDFNAGSILAGHTYAVSFSGMGIGNVAVELYYPPSTRAELTSTGAVGDAIPGTTDYFDVISTDAWRTFSFVFDSGTATSGRILFKGTGGKTDFGVDNVSVNVSAVPEPESYAMMLAGLGAMGFMARRRKSRV